MKNFIFVLKVCGNSIAKECSRIRFFHTKFVRTVIVVDNGKVSQCASRHASYIRTKGKAASVPECEDSPDFNSKLEEFGSKIWYNSVIEGSKLKLGWTQKKQFERKVEAKIARTRYKYHDNTPVALKYLSDLTIMKVPEEIVNESSISVDSSSESSEAQPSVDETECEEETVEQDVPLKEKLLLSQLNYGTPCKSIPTSKVNCGGCGALLHCQDPTVPGYMPSEEFRGKSVQELRHMVCQRCYLMDTFNVALNVSVPPEDYPKLMGEIKDKRALIILMVDLLDFPCSIWPQVFDIIGHNKPVCVVGNKLDLIPKDSTKSLENIKECLRKSVEGSGISAANIKHVCLISAKTRYGVEELITKLQNAWGSQGDVYLLGCTNVGKSTLFNALIHSDFCKIQVVDLISRATTSPWPGTTLNLLKFPITYPNRLRLYIRTQRLIAEREHRREEENMRRIKLKNTNHPKYAVVTGHVGKSFQEPVQAMDPFSINAGSALPKTFNPNHPDVREGKWCYDTPGSVQPDQIINLLSIEELMLTLPRRLLLPRTFYFKKEMTLFLAGLGRVDHVDGPGPVRVTVMASDDLPVTICSLESADEVYEAFLGTKLFAVPCGDESRLHSWPEMKSKEVEIEGCGWKECSADIVLSSAGWLAVSSAKNTRSRFRIHTPDGRGLYVRRPPLLKYIVNQKGKRIRGTFAYNKGKLFTS